MFPKHLLCRQPLSTSPFLSGAIIGGMVSYVVANEAVQRAAIGGLAHLWLSLKGGVEETKERFRDAEAQIKANRAE